MSNSKEVILSTGDGESLKVRMFAETGREVSTLMIDGVRYHFERIKGERLLADYSVDTDPDYKPQLDAEGYCYILAPYASR
jgi:hypothetical protein